MPSKSTTPAPPATYSRFQSPTGESWPKNAILNGPSLGASVSS